MRPTNGLGGLAPGPFRCSGLRLGPAAHDSIADEPRGDLERPDRILDPPADERPPEGPSACTGVVAASGVQKSAHLRPRRVRVTKRIARVHKSPHLARRAVEGDETHRDRRRIRGHERVTIRSASPSTSRAGATSLDEGPTGRPRLGDHSSRRGRCRCRTRPRVARARGRSRPDAKRTISATRPSARVSRSSLPVRRAGGGMGRTRTAGISASAARHSALLPQERRRGSRFPPAWKVDALDRTRPRPGSRRR